MYIYHADAPCSLTRLTNLTTERAAGYWYAESS